MEGGGEFIYAELIPLNQIFRDKIKQANSDDELNQIYDELKLKAFIDYRVDIKYLLKDKEFNELEIKSKKEILNMSLDKNMDYVLYDDLNSDEYSIDENTKKLNNVFYGEI